MTAWPKILSAVFLVAALAGCTTNPASGRNELTFMDREDELEIGRAQHPQIIEEFGGIHDDPALAAYVDGIGQRLAAVSELPELDFTFTVLNSEMVNAFALPGGFVYVTRGLLALANDEAEVAGVLGHEIGHVTARHAANRYQQSIYAGIGTIGATILGGILAGETGARLGQQLGSTGAQAWVAGYSRDQELESDQLGIRYLVRAGYDPQAMASFLATLGRHHELALALAGRSAEEAGVDWFASHPRTLDRVERAAAAAGDGDRRRDPFLDRIDGLVWGDDPSQGFVRGRRFIHPGLRFAFEAPEGFRLRNTPDAVLGVADGGRLMIFDGARVVPGRRMVDYLTDDWARALKAGRLRNVTTFEIDGLPAASASTSGRLQNGQRVDVGLAVIRADGEQVYRFRFLHLGTMDVEAARAYQATVESFRRLSQAEAAAIKPRRIAVVTVEAGEDVEDFARRMAVDARPREHFLVLNGLAPGEALTPGRRVKLIVED